MSVEDYLKNRERFEGIGRTGTAAEQNAARADAIKDMADRMEDALNKRGVYGPEAARQAQEMAQRAAQALDVLHSPDLIAGGSAAGTSGLGDRGVNRSIGATWAKNKGERVRQLDRVAADVPPAQRAATRMNVKLERCK